MKKMINSIKKLFKEDSNHCNKFDGSSQKEKSEQEPTKEKKSKKRKEQT